MLMFESLVRFITVFFAVVIFVWYIYGLVRLYRKEKEILQIKDRLDNIENDTDAKRALHSGMFNSFQFKKMNEKRKKPIMDKLETIKLERQFILDKLPLIGFFKK